MKKQIGLLLSVLILGLFAMAADASLADTYRAMISAEGTITVATFDLSIETNFTAIVPDTIVPGSYEATFNGAAFVSGRPIIVFTGVLNVSDIKFWVKFAVEKTGELPFACVRGCLYRANGTLKIDIEEIPPEQLEVTWFLMKGSITSYGGVQVFGGIMALARIGPIATEWAQVHGLFTQQEEQVNCSSIVFRLANVSEIDYAGENFRINGFWNVYNVTVTHYDGEFNLNIKPIVENGLGQLDANLVNKNFTVNIEGIEQIEGDIVFYHLTFRRLFEPGIPVCDSNNDWKIDMSDIARVAKAFGAMLGRSAYNFNLDVNLDFAINMKDIATVARDFGQQY